MIICAAIGDTHVDETTRFDECKEMLHETTNQAVAAGARCLVHTGDLYHRGSTPRERAAVAEWVMETSERIEGPMLFVRGNHDSFRDIEILGKVRTKHPLIVEEGFGIHDLKVAGRTLRVVALAWPRKAQVLAAIGRPVPPEESSRVAQEALSDTLLSAGGDSPYPKILVAHAMVTGSITSTGQPLVGQDMEIDLTMLSRVRADATALGHIHKPQDWDFPINGRTNPIIYTGSHRRTAYGEVEDKGWVKFIFDDKAEHGRRLISWSREILPCQEMVLIELSFTDGHLAGDVPTVRPKSDVRLRFTARPEEMATAKRAADRMAEPWRETECVVKLEPVVQAESAARVPEIALAKTTWNKLEIMWAARKDEMAPELTASLRSKVEELELIE